MFACVRNVLLTTDSCDDECEWRLEHERTCKHSTSLLWRRNDRQRVHADCRWPSSSSDIQTWVQKAKEAQLSQGKLSFLMIAVLWEEEFIKADKIRWIYLLSIWMMCFWTRWSDCLVWWLNSLAACVGSVVCFFIVQHHMTKHHSKLSQFLGKQLFLAFILHLAFPFELIHLICDSFDTTAKTYV